MKKLLVVCVSACLHAFTAYCAEVSSAEAREAVAGWATLGDALTGGARFDASGVSGVATYTGADGLGRFHVVSFEGGGFAVTSGDTEIAPILAYSESGEFVASEKNPLWCLLTQDVAGRTKRLEDEGVLAAKNAKNTKSLKASSAESSANASAWARLRDAAATPAKPLLKAAGYESEASVSDLRVEPLCRTLWAQREANGELCYNYYTPSSYPCGCIATALAQVMKHFEWPKTKVEVGSHWYVKTVNPPDAAAITWRMGVNPKTGESFPGLDPVFTGPEFGGPYDWANMPDDPASVEGLTETQRQAIGQLTRDCGIAVKMKYTPTGSSAYGYIVKNRLVDQFGYANAELIGQTFTADDRKRAMLASFDFGSPCFINITDGTGGGHAIVGDGYGYLADRLYIHFNFGWGDHPSTAWYTPSEDGESSLAIIHSLIYNIWTPEICAETNLTIVSGRVLDAGGEPASGLTVTARNRKTGATFSTISNAKGIYAFLLSPEATYEITAEKDGASAMASRRVGRCVSNPINEFDDGSTSYSYDVGECVANQPGVDLTLSADAQVPERWLDERAANSCLTGEWSQDVAYGADGKAFLDSGDGQILFAPYNASTGNVVTVETKAQFCEYTGNAVLDATAQAAVRLGTNGCFQVWSKTGNGEWGTGNGWLDVEAEGVTPVSGEEYTLRTTFDYTAGTYSVKVNDSALKLSTPNSQLSTSTSFPLATSTNCVTSIAFVGDTYFTSLLGEGRFEIIGFAEDDALILSNNVEVILTAAKSEWLNKCADGNKAAVASAAAKLTAKELNDAYLLNLDITGENFYTFEVTDIDVGDTSVTVAVTLTRTGKIEQKINGTLKFYGAATLAAFKAGTAAPIASTTLVDDDFSQGDTATATFDKNGNTFFNAKIEEK